MWKRIFLRCGGRSGQTGKTGPTETVVPVIQVAYLADRTLGSPAEARAGLWRGKSSCERCAVGTVRNPRNLETGNSRSGRLRLVVRGVIAPLGVFIKTGLDRRFADITIFTDILKTN